MPAKWVKFKGDCSFNEGKFTSVNNLLECLIKAWEWKKKKKRYLKKTNNPEEHYFLNTKLTILLYDCRTKPISDFE